MDTWNDFFDDAGNRLNISKLKYQTKNGKICLSYVHHVPARNEKSTLALVVRLLLKHSNVPEFSSVVQDYAMLLIKNTTKDDVFHSNSFGKVKANFTRFVIDSLSILLLFDAYSQQNMNTSPTPWATRNLSSIKEDQYINKSEQKILQENQMVLNKFCWKQNEDIAWKLFDTKNKKTGQLGWQVGELDTTWTASVRYVSKFNSGISSSYKDYQDTYKGDKRKDTM